MISEFVREQKRYTQNELCHILKCSEEHAMGKNLCRYYG